MNINDLYHQIILDHNANPKNYKILPEPTHQSEGHNPLCGDKVSVFLIIEDDTIKDISFQGDGCAISISSASIMTEELKGKSCERALEVFDNIRAMLIDNEEIDRKLSVFTGVREYPSRIKCVTMCFHAMKDALNSKE